MIDSPTLEALASTIATFAVIVAIGAFTSAIGQGMTARDGPGSESVRERWCEG